MFRARRQGLGPAFTNLFTANLSSSLGDGISRVAAPLLAARLTDDPLLVAGVTVAAMLPWLLLAIPAGVLVDRVDRRHALGFANGARTAAALALVLLVATGTLTIWWLLAVVFVYGALETVYDGAVRAVVPSLVGRTDLHRANSRIEAGELVVQNFAAAPLTSWLFAAAVVAPLGLGAAVFALAAVLAFLLPAAAAGTHRASTSEPAVRWYRQLVDGYRFIRGNRMLLTLWLLSTATGLCFAAATATWVVFVLDRLAVPEAWFGSVLLAGAVGGILGTLVVGRLATAFGTGPVMAVANLVASAALIGVGAVPTLWVGVAGFALTSAAITVWNVLVVSLRQSLVPSALLGRVHGTWRTLLWGTTPVGALLGGLLARVDLALPLLVGGVVATALALALFRFLAGLPDPAEVAPDTVGA
ncbi:MULTISPECIES: MFS transporter [unclassified Actinotalea]|uniref:MFS transporter n=1 Tax=unclassified Actinotalea TaxID=2638618 RepID=UPI0015F52BE8|nr:MULTISPECIES: MFS transporter [unclassified Actinotalea]